MLDSTPTGTLRYRHNAGAINQIPRGPGGGRGRPNYFSISVSNGFIASAQS